MQSSTFLLHSLLMSFIFVVYVEYISESSVLWPSVAFVPSDAANCDSDLQ